MLIQCLKTSIFNCGVRSLGHRGAGVRSVAPKRNAVHIREGKASDGIRWLIHQTPNIPQHRGLGIFFTPPRSHLSQPAAYLVTVSVLPRLSLWSHLYSPLVPHPPSASSLTSSVSPPLVPTSISGAYCSPTPRWLLNSQASSSGVSLP